MKSLGQVFIIISMMFLEGKALSEEQYAEIPEDRNYVIYQFNTMEEALPSLLSELAGEREPDLDKNRFNKERIIRLSEFFNRSEKNRDAAAKLLFRRFRETPPSSERNDLLLTMILIPHRSYFMFLVEMYTDLREKRMVFVAPADRKYLVDAIAASGQYDALPLLKRIVDSRAGIDIRYGEFSLIQFAADQDARPAISHLGKFGTLTALHKLEKLLAGEKGVPPLTPKEARHVISALKTLFRGAHSNPDREELYQASGRVRESLMASIGSPQYIDDSGTNTVTGVIEAIDEFRGQYKALAPFPSE